MPALPVLAQPFARAQVSWQAPYENGAAISAYTLYTNISEWPFVVSGATLELELNGLTPNTPYAMQLSANNSLGESGLTPLAVYWTDTYVPDQITDFVDPPQRSDSSITIDWTPPHDNGILIQKYEIKYRCPTPTCPVTSSATLPSGEGLVLSSDVCSPDPDTNQCSISSFTHNILAPNTQYEYRVRAYNGYDRFEYAFSPGWSDWSVWKLFTTSSDIPLLPPTPEAPNVSLVSSSYALLSWRVPSAATLGQTPSVNRYVATISTVGGVIIQINIFSGFSQGEDFTFNFTGLIPSTQYNVSIAASNTEGEGSFSDDAVFVTSDSVPVRLGSIDIAGGRFVRSLPRLVGRPWATTRRRVHQHLYQLELDSRPQQRRCNPLS